jgi:hypothetical protein
VPAKTGNSDDRLGQVGRPFPGCGINPLRGKNRVATLVPNTIAIEDGTQDRRQVMHRRKPSAAELVIRPIVDATRCPPSLLSRLIHFFTRLWTTSVCAPDTPLNSVGRFFPSGSKQTFSVSPLIS